MNPIESVIAVLRNCINFRGRSPRSEFWWFFLLTSIVGGTLLGVLTAVLFALGFNEDRVSGIVSGAFWIFLLAVLLPSLAVTTRRLHDTERPAWWILLPIVPFVTGMVLIVLLTTTHSLQELPELLVYFLILVLILSIPGAFVGLFILLKPLLRAGDNGTNRYGPNPTNQ